MSQRRRPRAVTVLGDVNVELEAELTQLEFRSITRDTLSYAQMGVTVGGTAANFALAAIAHFDRVRVVGRVGTDAFAAVIRDALRGAGVAAHLSIDPVHPSGLAMLLRDGSSAAHRGVRHLVVRAESANSALDIEAINRAREVIVASDVFLTDGYGLLNEPRRSAYLHAMRLAREAARIVVLDVVPHDCYRRYGVDELKRFTADVNVMICELRTIRSFLGLATSAGVLDVDLARATIPAVRGAFPDKWVFLRFGIGEANESILAPPAGEASHSLTGYVGEERVAGFGDRLAAREIAQLIATWSPE
jgi:sugar/nucleoside kinase (ribokinase family)